MDLPLSTSYSEQIGHVLMRGAHSPPGGNGKASLARRHSGSRLGSRGHGHRWIGL